MDASKMTRADLQKIIATGKKGKFDPAPYKSVDKELKTFREAGKSLADLAKKNPNE